MTNAEASVEAAAVAVPKRRQGGFFSLPDRMGLALTVYRTLLFVGLGLQGFELLAMDASLLGFARTPLDMHGVAARLVPPYRTDLSMDGGFAGMGVLATMGCFLICLPSTSLRRRHRWLRWLLYLLFLIGLGTPQF